jgi:hypothetical protein
MFYPVLCVTMANPRRCSLSSIYAQLGSPVVDFHSFWTVYNTLRNAADLDIFSSCTVMISRARTHLKVARILSVSHLCPCVNGVPATQTVQHGGNADNLSLYFLIHFLSPLDRPEVFVEAPRMKV